ncbi:hypothetical protein NDU88_008368 [Pleurodeles waltl]|uniref:Uncharacterized protein n=1 Tax=Pleurodeles waltl TaxID=8319 RepID=A0AAV7PWG1_PLEWA|nr:hypothetical protein NDU88_008368 [Pleurodeles waltl]
MATESERSPGSHKTLTGPCHQITGAAAKYSWSWSIQGDAVTRQTSQGLGQASRREARLEHQAWDTALEPRVAVEQLISGALVFRCKQAPALAPARRAEPARLGASRDHWRDRPRGEGSRPRTQPGCLLCARRLPLLMEAHPWETEVIAESHTDQTRCPEKTDGWQSLGHMAAWERQHDNPLSASYLVRETRTRVVPVSCTPLLVWWTLRDRQ